MVKQWPPRSPNPEFQKAELSSGMKNHQVRCSETLPGNDPSTGRRTSAGEYNWNSKAALLHKLKNESGKLNSCKGAQIGKRHMWFRKQVRLIVCTFVLMGFFFLFDSLMVSIFDSVNLQDSSTSKDSRGLQVRSCIFFFFIRMPCRTSWYISEIVLL